MIPIAYAVTCVMLYMLVVALHNFLRFPHLQVMPPRSASCRPSVSVLIPARNEARNIGLAVATILQSTYPSFEVIILDDASSDDTATLARRAAQDDARLRVEQGLPLPQGWLGKSWACHQLAQLTDSDLLIFADADVRWTPTALPAVVAHQQAVRADLLAVWPTQVTRSIGERLTVPMMSLTLLAYLPIAWAHDSRMVTAAAANGQCLVFHRQAYHAIGGHQSVRHTVLEDIALARLIKQRGLRLRMVDGAGLILCRMYHGLWEAISGYTKNILAAHANSATLLLFSTLAHLALFVVPWLWLLGGLFVPLAAWPFWPALLIAVGLLIRLLVSMTAHLPLRDGCLLPFTALLASFIALRAVWLHLFAGGPNWKGRPIHPCREPDHDTR